MIEKSHTVGIVRGVSASAAAAAQRGRTQRRSGCYEKSSILIAVPAFNEAEHLPALLAGIRIAAPGIPLLVIDDGSTDATADLLNCSKVMTLRHRVNAGKGAALRTALDAARERGFHWLITLDGDGQHAPEALPLFALEIDRGEADVIIGNRRDRSGKMPLIRQLSNGIASVLVSLFAGFRFHDSQCGFRALRVDLPGLALCRENGFQYESEMLILLARSGCRFAEVIIDTQYHGSRSRIGYFADTLKFIAICARSIWQ